MIVMFRFFFSIQFVVACYLLDHFCLHDISDDKMERALEIISETCWDGDIEEAKQRRLGLHDIAGLETGLLPTTGNGAAKKRATTAIDENASYSSLVGSSGF